MAISNIHYHGQPSQCLNFQSSDKLINIGHAMTLEIIFHSFHHFNRHSWVNKIGRTNLHSRCTCQHKLYSVCRIHDTSQSDYRNFNRTTHLPHHTQGNRFHTRSRQPTRYRRFSALISIPNSVLMSDTESAPSASTALAISVISVTLGESFTIRVL